jgi:hypothetical protein
MKKMVVVFGGGCGLDLVLPLVILTHCFEIDHSVGWLLACLLACLLAFILPRLHLLPKHRKHLWSTNCYGQP